MLDQANILAFLTNALCIVERVDVIFQFNVFELFMVLLSYLLALWLIKPIANIHNNVRTRTFRCYKLGLFIL